MKKKLKFCLLTALALLFLVIVPLKVQANNSGIANNIPNNTMFQKSAGTMFSNNQSNSFVSGSNSNPYSRTFFGGNLCSQPKKYSQITITKRDKKTNQLLSGAMFEIRKNGNVMQIVTTDWTGTATGNVLSGFSYTITEVIAPAGYTLDKNTSSPLYVQYGLCYTYTAYNSKVENPVPPVPPVPVPKKGTMKINKYDVTTNIALAGAEYTIYNKNGKVVQVITTNKNGIAKTKALPLGTYTFKETKAPKGYQIDSSIKSFTLSFAGQVVNLSHPNTPVVAKKGSIEIVKKDEDNQPLYGAIFQVYNESGESVGIAHTDVNGSATVSNLPYGTYKVVEIIAPAGHILDSTPKYVTISGANPGGKATLTIINKKQKGLIEVIKVDEAGQRLAGATYNIFDAKDKLVTTVTTDQDGLATINNLPYGKYKLVETKAPAGYVLDTTPQYVTLSEDSPNGKASITLSNKKEIAKTGDLKIIKYIKDSSPEEYLTGAVFEIYNKQFQLIGVHTTDENGVIVLTGLEPGTYHIVEKTAPEGYEPDTRFYSIAVVAGNVAEIKHPNSKIITTGRLKLTKYANDSNGNPTTTRLSDGGFEVTDANGKKYNVVTDSNGEAYIDNLPAGAVSITETKAPLNYLIETETKKGTIIAKETTEIDFYNNPNQEGRALIFVNSTNNLTNISGLTYKITLLDSRIEKTYDVVTNNYGQISIYLPIGEYKIESTTQTGNNNLGRNANFTINPSQLTIVNLSL